MKLSTMIKRLQSLEKKYGGDTLILQKNFAICSEEEPRRFVKGGTMCGRRKNDKAREVIVIQSGSYVDYLNSEGC